MWESQHRSRPRTPAEFPDRWVSSGRGELGLECGDGIAPADAFGLVAGGLYTDRQRLGAMVDDFDVVAGLGKPPRPRSSQVLQGVTQGGAGAMQVRLH